jgi:large subunit ribosomal protein L19
MKAREYTKETITAVGQREESLPEFNIGDTIGVHLKIKEGDKERIQLFQGDVIAIKHRGASGSFTVRKIGAHNIPVERILPFHSPIIKDITVVKRGDVRRAKLYYVRDRVGKAARIKEKREKKAVAPKVPAKAVVDATVTEEVAAK